MRSLRHTCQSFPPLDFPPQKNRFCICEIRRVQRESKNRHANKEIYAGRRTRIALGSWNELGAAGTHHFLFVAPLHIHRSPSLLDLSFCTYRDGWLHNLEDVRATTMQKRGAARRGAARPQPCIRASGALACRKFRARARCYGIRVPRVWHEVCQIV